MDPIKAVEDKWELVPAFLQVKGLVKQHIDSYNYFVDHDLKNIIKATKRSHHQISTPISTSNIPTSLSESLVDTTEMPCNGPSHHIVSSSRTSPPTRRISLSTSNTQEVARSFVERMWLSDAFRSMLRSNKCVLSNKSEKELAKMSECPLDPGGYLSSREQKRSSLFKNTQQEQNHRRGRYKERYRLSIRHFINARAQVQVVCSDKAWQNLSQAQLATHEDIPIAVAFQAMCIQADREILQLVAGHDDVYQGAVSRSIWKKLLVLESTHASKHWDYIGARAKASRKPLSMRRPLAEEALDVSRPSSLPTCLSSDSTSPLKPSTSPPWSASPDGHAR